MTNPFIDICGLEKKSDLKKFCRSAIVHQSQFVDFILASDAGLLPWEHERHHRDFLPTELEITDQDHENLSNADVGVPNKGVGKLYNKMTQILEQRRLLSGHIFFTPSLENWHLFYFDQRDVRGRRTTGKVARTSISSIGYGRGETLRTNGTTFALGTSSCEGPFTFGTNRTATKTASALVR